MERKEQGGNDTSSVAIAWHWAIHLELLVEGHAELQDDSVSILESVERSQDLEKSKVGEWFLCRLTKVRPGKRKAELNEQAYFLILFAEIRRVSSSSTLGVTIAHDLSWAAQIRSISKTASQRIGSLYRSIRFLTPEACLHLYKSTISHGVLLSLVTYGKVHQSLISLLDRV